MSDARPTFLGIGAPRSGTTWLYSVLRSHPQIYMPPVKELHYFDISDKYPSPNITGRQDSPWWRRTHKESANASNEDTKHWYEKYLYGDYTDNWYLSLFDDSRGRKCGEITPSYMMLEKPDIERIKKINPALKIILQLRNPIERAWSGLQQLLDRRGLGLQELTKPELIGELTSMGSRRRGNYTKTIEEWTSVFPEDQMLIIYYDEIKSHPRELVKTVLTFLSLEPDPKELVIPARRLNSSTSREMPADLRDFLNDLYRTEIEHLNKRIPGPNVSRWLQECGSGNGVD